MSKKQSNATVNDQANAWADALDGGTIEIYAGTEPSTADTALSGNTLLGVLTLGTPAFGAAVNGVVTANAITQDGAADNSGVATFYRTKRAGGAVHEQGSAGVSGSGADLILNSTNIVAGGTINVTSYVHTVPKQ